MQKLVAFLSGLIFAVGLVISRMTDPSVVLAFLNVSGDWDPTLLYVLCGAVASAFIGQLITKRLHRPVFSVEFHLPKSTEIDSKLLLGAAIFGVGWGLAGYCPGPAITGITFFSGKTTLFVISMLAGVLVYQQLSKKFNI